MYGKILFTISIFKIIDCFYLEAESNYLKPKLERNNIVNKGIWVRNKFQDIFSDKNKLGTFIFRTNSMDVDHAQNNFDPFGGNALLESPFMSSYFQRKRRSPDQIRKRRPRKSKNIATTIKSSIEDSVIIKSKIVSDLKPTSVFNEYPYEVAILLNNDLDKTHNSTIKKELKRIESNVSKPDNKTTSKTDAINHEQQKYEVILLNTNATIITNVPKRSKKYNLNNDHVHKDNYNFIEGNNNTEMVTIPIKQDREVFQKTDNSMTDWKVDTQIPDSNIYKVVPADIIKSKSVTERGLIKIISMLTKTFKKIMKKHNEIKNINDKLTDMNQNFDEKVNELTSKFEDFDSKYSDMIQFNDKIKAFESDLISQRENFELKEKEIQNTFAEFQDQQKKFLAQQRQFYGIQKLMLAQNEKINMKQNLIAKTQSQISHRQNNFARILKKAKQIINENKIKVNNSHEYKEQDKYNSQFDKTVIPVTTTQVPVNTQAMKINLFSIPTKNKLENQDALIIKEKDDKQIDDLVYKYYFNNTFIDSLMKSKILNNYAATLNSVEIVNRSKLSKKKRNKFETTKMFPINNSLSDSPIKRERRWINHFSRNKYKRLNRHLKTAAANQTVKPTRLITEHNDTKRRELKQDQSFNEVKRTENSKSDPFMVMATNFCNEIGQNVNELVLKWCVEKAIRRLKFMEMNAFTPPPEAVTMTKKTHVTEITVPSERQLNKHSYEISTHAVSQKPVPRAEETTLKPIVTWYTPVFVTSRQYAPAHLSSVPSKPGQEIFFPDNDELESNLKQYELTPDTEGNVYYEGSVHMSDYAHHTRDSGGASDIMPGLMESNSKVDINPLAFDIQAKRRAYVRRLNEDILNRMRGWK